MEEEFDLEVEMEKVIFSKTLPETLNVPKIIEEYKKEIDRFLQDFRPVTEREYNEKNRAVKLKKVTHRNGFYIGETKKYNTIKRGRRKVKKKRLREGWGTYYYTDKRDFFTGFWEKNKKNGRGLYTFATSDKYFGNFEDNKLVGKGVQITKAGMITIGEWDTDGSGKGIRIVRDEIFYGKWTKLTRKGKYYTKNGSYFFGNWIRRTIHDKWKKEGNGKLFLVPKRIEVVGTWNNDFLNGFGISKNFQRRILFLENWKNGIRTGFGIEIHHNTNGTGKKIIRYLDHKTKIGMFIRKTFQGDKLKGVEINKYENGKKKFAIVSMNGFETDLYVGNMHRFQRSTERGISFYKDRNYFFIGGIARNKFSGIGKLVSIQNNIWETYRGYFKNGKYDGIGESKSSANYFLGEFKENKINGVGKLINLLDTPKKTYVGEFKNNKLHGTGCLSFGEAKIFGTWKKGEKDGYFEIEMFLRNGDKCIFKGYCKANFIEGRGRIVFQDGDSLEARWKNNKIHGKAGFFAKKLMYRCYFDHNRLIYFSKVEKEKRNDDEMFFEYLKEPTQEEKKAEVRMRMIQELFRQMKRNEKKEIFPIER